MGRANRGAPRSRGSVRTILLFLLRLAVECVSTPLVEYTLPFLRLMAGSLLLKSIGGLASPLNAPANLIVGDASTPVKYLTIGRGSSVVQWSCGRYPGYRVFSNSSTNQVVFSCR